MDRLQILEILYANASEQPSPQPIKVASIAEMLKLSTSEVQREIKILDFDTLVQCDCEWQQLIITKRGIDQLLDKA